MRTQERGERLKKGEGQREVEGRKEGERQKRGDGQPCNSLNPKPIRGNPDRPETTHLHDDRKRAVGVEDSVIDHGSVVGHPHSVDRLNGLGAVVAHDSAP